MKYFNIFKNDKKVQGDTQPDYNISVNIGTKEQPVNMNAGGCWLKEGTKGKYFSCKLSDLYVDQTTKTARPGFDLIQEGIDRVKEMPEIVETDNVKLEDIPF